MEIKDRDDGLDDRAWERLCVLVVAAWEGDRSAFMSEIQCWPVEVPLGEQHRIGLYSHAGIKYVTQRILRRRPSEADLKELAARCFPGVSKVLALYPLAVEDALRHAFRLGPVRRKLSPGELGLVNAAAVGCLLTKPEDELPEIRGYVAEWWKVNARVIHEAGVKDS